MNTTLVWDIAALVVFYVLICITAAIIDIRHGTSMFFLWKSLLRRARLQAVLLILTATLCIGMFELFFPRSTSFIFNFLSEYEDKTQHRKPLFVLAPGAIILGDAFYSGFRYRNKTQGTRIKK